MSEQGIAQDFRGEALEQRRDELQRKSTDSERRMAELTAAYDRRLATKRRDAERSS